MQRSLDRLRSRELVIKLFSSLPAHLEEHLREPEWRCSVCASKGDIQRTFSQAVGLRLSEGRTRDVRLDDLASSPFALADTLNDLSRYIRVTTPHQSRCSIMKSLRTRTCRMCVDRMSRRGVDIRPRCCEGTITFLLLTSNDVNIGGCEGPHGCQKCREGLMLC